MPQGIKTAPAWFQRKVDKTLNKLMIRNTVVPFMDYIVLHTRTRNQHRDEAFDLVETLKSGNLKLSKKKCKVMKSEVAFFGHVISHKNIKTDVTKAACIAEMKVPATLTDLQSSIGMFRWRRPFIKDFGKIAQPLYDLMGTKTIPTKLRKKNGR